MIPRHFFVLSIILLVAVSIRFFQLDQYPVGLHIDEASLGYNAYSLLHTLKDENGNPFPLYIDMFGDNRPSGYHILTMLPVALFGLNEFSTRFLAAFFGAISVIAVYFFGLSFSQNRTVALVSALLLAFSPWHIVISRASGEAVVALFFVILGYALLLHGVRKKSSFLVVLGGGVTILSYFFYHTPRVFVPLVLLSTGMYLFFFAKRMMAKKILFSYVTIFVISCVVAGILILYVSGGTGRFQQINIFNSFETSFYMKNQLLQDGISGSSWIASRFFHNHVTNVGLVFIDNYLSYFSFNFLFTKGGLPEWYIVPRMGLLYLIELPFLILGMYWLIRAKEPEHKLVIGLLFLSPVVAALTMDDIPNVNRAIVMVPSLVVIIATGVVKTIEHVTKRKQILIAFIIFVFCMNILYFFHQYFFNATVNNTIDRQDGFKELITVLKKDYDAYDRVIFTSSYGGIYPIVLFYTQYPPFMYQKEGSPKNADYKGFGKFVFVPQDCPSTQKTDIFSPVEHTIYVDRGDCVYEVGKHVFIFRRDTTKAFQIVYE